LSIGAIKLGADRCYAVDTDSLAVTATAKNRDLNQLSDRQISVEMGSIEQIKALADAGIEFDGIVCNILAEIIVGLVPTMTEIATPKTWAILSGILTSQANEMAALLEQHHWIIATLWKRDEWCCFNIRRR
jgi:ribosomal protein L11 methyltransferase